MWGQTEVLNGSAQFFSLLGAGWETQQSSKPALWQASGQPASHTMASLRPEPHTTWWDGAGPFAEKPRSTGKYVRSGQRLTKLSCCLLTDLCEETGPAPPEALETGRLKLRWMASGPSLWYRRERWGYLSSCSQNWLRTGPGWCLQVRATARPHYKV